ncbi:MAG: orotate phosphoribosyltransferase [Chloroflexi bacterium]|nr:orotate phosphoribosyltransferase [Chloroflexota bacterium]
MAEKDRLLELFQSAVRYGEHTLTSGLKSSYYIDGKMVTFSPEGAYLVGKILFDLLKDRGVQAVGGMTMGADPIATAIAVVSHLEDKSIPAFAVRNDTKEHGTQKRIEGPLPSTGERKVAIVEDVVTTGGSSFRAIAAVEEAGCQVVKVLALVDRHQGGSDKLKERYDFSALFDCDAEGKLTLAK